MTWREISFAGFEGREARLAIKRYNDRSPMWYRSTVFCHTQRTRFLLEEVIPLAEIALNLFDPEKARTLAEIHDDPEMHKQEDIPAHVKRKMTPKEKAELQRDELEAIDILAERFPKTINGYSYRELLQTHTNNKGCRESKVVSYVDKIDAWCESLHELFAGNRTFHAEIDGVRPPVSGSVVKELWREYPEIKILRERAYDHPFFICPPRVDREEILASGKPHTPESIRQKTGHPYYDRWREILLDRWGEKGVAYLTEIKEGPLAHEPKPS